MRYFLSCTCIFAAVLIGSCSSGDRKNNAGNPGTGITDTAQLTTIRWVDSVKDFGKIREGQKLEVGFRFINTGDKPLVIERVQPSCGCTVAEQSTEPVQPGKEGQIRATFSSEGRTGINHKTLSVYANTKGNPIHTLQFSVEVERILGQ